MTHTYTFRCIPLEQEAGYIISTKEMIDHNQQVNDVGTVSAMPAKPWSLVKRSDNYDPAVYGNVPSLPDLKDKIRDDEMSLPMYTTKKHAHV